MKILVGILLAPLISGLIAWSLNRKSVKWYKWDYGVPFYGTAVWFLLASSGVGPQSLSQIVEVIYIIIPLSTLAPWGRVLFPGRTKVASIKSSLIFLSIPVIVAVLLRLFMPLLPE